MGNSAPSLKSSYTIVLSSTNGLYASDTKTNFHNEIRDLNSGFLPKGTVLKAISGTGFVLSGTPAAAFARHSIYVEMDVFSQGDGFDCRVDVQKNIPRVIAEYIPVDVVYVDAQTLYVLYQLKPTEGVVIQDPDFLKNKRVNVKLTYYDPTSKEWLAVDAASVLCASMSIVLQLAQ